MCYKSTNLQLILQNNIMLKKYNAQVTEEYSYICIINNVNILYIFLTNIYANLFSFAIFYLLRDLNKHSQIRLK
jgi:hypothetical protein